MQYKVGATFQIEPFQSGDQRNVRGILERIGWEEAVILAFEQAALRFSGNSDAAVFMARQHAATIGFVLVQFNAWNRLAQIQGLAVDPGWHRKGVATALAAEAETFARTVRSRGIYVDTPVDNTRGRRLYEAIGYRVGYIMPRYYGDALDGVTYQKFFAANAPLKQNTADV